MGIDSTSIEINRIYLEQLVFNKLFFNFRSLHFTVHLSLRS